MGAEKWQCPINATAVAIQPKMYLESSKEPIEARYGRGTCHRARTSWLAILLSHKPAYSSRCKRGTRMIHSRPFDILFKLQKRICLFCLHWGIALQSIVAFAFFTPTPAAA